MKWIVKNTLNLWILERIIINFNKIILTFKVDIYAHKSYPLIIIRICSA